MFETHAPFMIKSRNISIAALMCLGLSGCLTNPIRFEAGSDGIEFTAHAPALGNCQLSGVSVRNTTSDPIAPSGEIYSLKGNDTVSVFNFHCSKTFPGGSSNCSGYAKNLGYNIDGMCKHKMSYRK